MFRFGEVGYSCGLAKLGQVSVWCRNVQCSGGGVLLGLVEVQSCWVLLG